MNHQWALAWLGVGHSLAGFEYLQTLQELTGNLVCNPVFLYFKLLWTHRPTPSLLAVTAINIPVRISNDWNQTETRLIFCRHLTPQKILHAVRKRANICSTCTLSWIKARWRTLDRLTLLITVFRAAGWRLISDVFVLLQSQDRLGSTSLHLTRTCSYLETPDTNLKLHSQAVGIPA